MRASSPVFLLLCLARLFATPWTVAHQDPLSMGYPRQEDWSELPFPLPGDLRQPGIEPTSTALAGRFSATLTHPIIYLTYMIEKICFNERNAITESYLHMYFRCRIFKI